jgi:hypothetical protein
MLILSLPEHERQGTCRINGRDARFRIDGDHLTYAFTSEPDTEKTFEILDAAPTGEGLVIYSCVEQGSSAVVITPVITHTREQVLASARRQRAAYRRGRLTQDQIAKLDAILGWTWE